MGTYMLIYRAHICGHLSQCGITTYMCICMCRIYALIILLCYCRIYAVRMCCIPHHICAQIYRVCYHMIYAITYMLIPWYRLLLQHICLTVSLWNRQNIYGVHNLQVYVTHTVVSGLHICDIWQTKVTKSCGIYADKSRIYAEKGCTYIYATISLIWVT